MSKKHKLNLARDLLDKQLIDRNGDPMGRADGVVIVVETDGTKPPSVTTIESGGAILARRLHPRFERAFLALARRFGLRRGAPARIPWDKVRIKGIELHAEVDRTHLPTFAWESWLREHIIRFIPIAKPEKHK